jgi:hypothetical protein
VAVGCGDAIRGCTASSFTGRVTVGTPGALRRVVVRLDGRQIVTSRRKSLRVSINARPLSSGRHTLSATATTASGRVVSRSVSFFRCARAAPRFTG